VTLNVLLSPGAPPTRRLAPSSDGLRLIASGMAYLLVVCSVVIVTSAFSILGESAFVPNRVFDDRDLIALFGWVGMMIAGVSVIIVPNHLGVCLRPLYLPRLHFFLANIGLMGFFGTSLLVPGTPASEVFLGLVAVSFLLFGLGVLVTVALFARSFMARPTVETTTATEHRTTG
jgi:hypothetical protein